MNGGTELRSIGQQPATCLLHLPSSRSSGIYASLGQVWCYEPGEGHGCLAVRQLGSEKNCQYLQVDSPVTCLEACAKNNIWLGHADGTISVRSESQQALLCPSLKLFNCAVTSISVDMRGVGWVGSAEGAVKLAEMMTKRRQAGAAGIILTASRSLQLQGLHRIAEEGSGPLAPHPVHSGAVTVTEMYNTRIWTSGGTLGDCSIAEWDLNGNHQGSADTSQYGLMVALLALPLGLRRQPVDCNSASAAASTDADDWAPASAHDSGSVVLWSAHEGGCVTPSLILHPSSGPCRAMAFLDAVGLWCIAYSNGIVMIQPITCLQVPGGQAPFAPQNSNDNFISLVAHEAGLSTAAGSNDLLLTAGADGSLVFWAEFQLLAQGPAALSAILQPLHAGNAEPADVSQQMMNMHFSEANGAHAISAVQAAMRSNKSRRSSIDTDSLPRDGTFGRSDMSRANAMDLLAEVVRLMRPKSHQANELQGFDHIPALSSKGSAFQSGPPLSYSESSNTSAPQSPHSPFGASAEGQSDKMVRAPSEVKSTSDSFQSWASDNFGRQASLNWIILFDSLTLIRKVAEGSIGQVFLGRYQETDVAVKALSGLHQLRSALSAAPPAIRSNLNALNSYLASVAATDQDTATTLQSLEREVGIMASLRHPNIVLFMGMTIDPPCLVSEWCSRGSIFDILNRASKSPAAAAQMTWHRRLHMALDAAKGIYQLHQHAPQIVHCDLKSPNLVCDAHWRVKVTDFNLSCMMDASAGAASLMANNPRWQAPEAIRHQKFTTKSDVFSFGVILWEFITWKLPWDSMSAFQIINAVSTKNERLDLPKDADDELCATCTLPDASSPAVVSGLRKLISRCWVDDPAARPDFPEVIADLRSLLEECRSAVPEARARRRSVLQGDSPCSPNQSRRQSQERESRPTSPAQRASEVAPVIQGPSGEPCDRHAALGPAALHNVLPPPSPLQATSHHPPDLSLSDLGSPAEDPESNGGPPESPSAAVAASPFADMALPRFGSSISPANSSANEFPSGVISGSIQPMQSAKAEYDTGRVPKFSTFPDS